ncbi:MAG: FtsQ-type POTRA domain-containing protein [Solirubrobacteraceae bacterium]
MELSLPVLRREPRRTSRNGVTRRRGGHHPLARLIALVRANRLALRALVCALLAIPLLGGGWMWLRGSSLVSVRHVRITGVQGIDGSQIRTALDDAATRMTTLDFNTTALRSAVAQFTIVGGVRAVTSFPHTVRISVTERPPVAELLSAGQRTAVAADGVVLGPALLAGSLPRINGSIEPAPGAHLHESAALSAVAVLGAAPPALARFVARVYEDGQEGLTVAMRNGLLVYFGDATRPRAKWLSLARVLVSPSAAGALYVDVRLPERPAAGFSLPSSPSSTSTSTSASASTLAQSGSADPTAATLAASLEAAIGEGTPTGSATSSEPSSAGATESEASDAGTPEASSSGASETSGASPSAASSTPGSETAESATG